MDRAENTLLVIVGLDADDDRICKREINNSFRKKGIYYFGQQPFEKLPAILSIADIIAIPQSSSNATKGQLPAKLIDAMCMQIPIVSTSVSDIPDILANECGLLSEPDNMEAMAKNLSLILDNPKLGQKLAKNARAKCIEQYSYQTGEKKLRKIISRLLEL